MSTLRRRNGRGFRVCSLAALLHLECFRVRAQRALGVGKGRGIDLFQLPVLSAYPPDELHQLVGVHRHRHSLATSPHLSLT